MKWIKVQDGLPKPLESVIALTVIPVMINGVSNFDKIGIQARFNPEKGWEFFFPHSWNDRWKVIAWMPLSDFKE